MKVRRIVANIATTDTAKAKVFYQDLLGLLELTSSNGCSAP